MPDGLTLAAFLLLLVLLYAWALAERAADRRSRIEDEHRRRQRVLATIDRIVEAEYRASLQFDRELERLLEEEAA